MDKKRSISQNEIIRGVNVRSGKNKVGKVILIIEFILFILGVIFNKKLGLVDTPMFLESISLPLIIIGVILLITSNLFQENLESKV